MGDLRVEVGQGQLETVVHVFILGQQVEGQGQDEADDGTIK